VFRVLLLFQSLLSPQEELLFHVVSQQNSKDAVHSVLGLTRGQLQPSPLVEASLVRLGVIAMEMQERSMFSQQFQMFEVWSHFASQLVFFHYLHLIDITTLLGKLKDKVRCCQMVGLRSAPTILTCVCVV